MNPVINALGTISEQVIKWSIVGRTEKNGLPSIATKIHMLKHDKIVKAWLTSYIQKQAKRKVKSI